MPRRSTALFGLVLLLAACGTEAPPRSTTDPAVTAAAFPVTLTDDEDVEVTIDSAPDRIVTYAPSHTETLFALGLGERVVGVSGPFDDYPPQAKGIEHVSGEAGTEPSVETVVGLEPDLVLTAFIGGEWKTRLRELDIPVFTTLAANLDDAVADIETIGKLTGATEAATSLVDDIEGQAEQIAQGIPEEARVTCFLELSDLYTVGPGALEYDMLERAGCDPVTSSASEAYPQWSVEQLVQDDPDVFLASEFGQGVEAVANRPGVKELRAIREGRVKLVDGDLISRPGPRMVQGLRALVEALGTA
ncbi:MAG TPA: helical backbone metal receptor [Actinomycetota bacterium]|nr:helical backbone metal receptor [Actinomycetota bacterium]